MPVAPIIHIGGWPGAGKQAVGRIVADRIGGRLIHNHLMLDAARALYARDTPESKALREEVRGVILAHARALPPEIPIVLTDALSAGNADAARLFQPTLDLARDRGAPLVCFVLELSVEENVARLTEPARFGGAKLTDVDILLSLRERETLFLPDGAHVLDVTDLTPEQAADRMLLLAKNTSGVRGLAPGSTLAPTATDA
ncbi:MAG: nucleoside kinase [Pseudomonadota bacterium]